MKDKIKCKSCHKLRVIYFKGLCQNCYRIELKKRKENTKLIFNYDNLNDISKEVVKKYEEGLTIKEIKEYLEQKNINITIRYIYYIIEKNVERVDKDGY